MCTIAVWCYPESMWYLAWIHRSNTGSLTPECLSNYNLTLDVKAELLYVQVDIPERPVKVQQKPRAKGGSPFSQLLTRPHTQTRCFPHPRAICKSIPTPGKGRWMLAGSVKRRWWLWMMQPCQTVTEGGDKRKETCRFCPDDNVYD